MELLALVDIHCGPNSSELVVVLLLWAVACAGRINNHCWKLTPDHKTSYLAVSRPMSWTEGNQYCRDVGGNLLVIQSVKDQLFYQKINNNNEMFWIGLEYNNIHEKWQWIDHSVLDVRITPWDHWEPDTGDPGQGCVEYMRGTADINDVHCRRKKCGICYTGSEALTHLPVPFNYSSLDFVREWKTWKSAYLECRKRGWSLVKLRTWRERAVLNYYILHDKSGCRSYWLERDRKVLSKMKWANPNVHLLEYSIPEMPENANENCAAMSNGSLSDLPCTEKLPVVCTKAHKITEYDQDPRTIFICFNYSTLMEVVIVMVFGVFCIFCGERYQPVKMFQSAINHWKNGKKVWNDFTNQNSENNFSYMTDQLQSVSCYSEETDNYTKYTDVETGIPNKEDFGQKITPPDEQDSNNCSMCGIGLEFEGTYDEEICEYMDLCKKCKEEMEMNEINLGGK